jgi:hypothetical protein
MGIFGVSKNPFLARGLGVKVKGRVVKQDFFIGRC